MHGLPFPPEAAHRFGAYTLVTLADEQGWLGAFALGGGIRRGVRAMVGGGVNDAPVLAQAHVSIAMGSGAPLAQTRSDMVLMSTRPANLAHAVTVARRTCKH